MPIVPEEASRQEEEQARKTSREALIEEMKLCESPPEMWLMPEDVSQKDHSLALVNM